MVQDVRLGTHAYVVFEATRDVVISNAAGLSHFADTHARIKQTVLNCVVEHTHVSRPCGVRAWKALFVCVALFVDGFEGGGIPIRISLEEACAAYTQSFSQT